VTEKVTVYMLIHYINLSSFACCVYPFSGARAKCALEDIVVIVHGWPKNRLFGELITMGQLRREACDMSKVLEFCLVKYTTCMLYVFFV